MWLGDFIHLTTGFAGAHVSVQDNVFFKVFGLVLGALALFTVSIIFLANRISAPDEAYIDPLAHAQLAQIEYSLWELPVLRRHHNNSAKCTGLLQPVIRSDF